MSLKPYYYYLVGEGLKTVEMRKRVPNLLKWNNFIYFYMSKDENSFSRIPIELQEKYRQHFGKVGLVAQIDRIYDVDAVIDNITGKLEYRADFLFETRACLTKQEVDNYLKGKDGYGLRIYQQHFIYDGVLDIGDFYSLPKPVNKWTDKDDCCHCRYHKWVWKGRPSGLPWYEKCRSKLPEPECEYSPNLDKPPQSFCFVQEALR